MTSPPNFAVAKRVRVGDNHPVDRDGRKARAEMPDVATGGNPRAAAWCACPGILWNSRTAVSSHNVTTAAHAVADSTVLNMGRDAMIPLSFAESRGPLASRDRGRIPRFFALTVHAAHPDAVWTKSLARAKRHQSPTGKVTGCGRMRGTDPRRADLGPHAVSLVSTTGGNGILVWGHGLMRSQMRGTLVMLAARRSAWTASNPSPVRGTGGGGYPSAGNTARQVERTLMTRQAQHTSGVKSSR